MGMTFISPADLDSSMHSYSSRKTKIIATLVAIVTFGAIGYALAFLMSIRLLRAIRRTERPRENR